MPPLEQERVNSEDQLEREKIAWDNVERLGWSYSTALAILKAKDALYGKERFRNLRELSEVLEGRKKVETDFQGTMLNVARRRLIFSALSLPLERLPDTDQNIFQDWGYQIIDFSSFNRKWDRVQPLLYVEGEGLFSADGFNCDSLQ